RSRLLPTRRMYCNDIPKGVAVVGFKHVTEFMSDEVVDDEHRRLYYPPAEGKRAATRTSAPPILHFSHGDSFKGDAHVPRPCVDSWRERDLRLREVPSCKKGSCATAILPRQLETRTIESYAIARLGDESKSKTLAEIQKGLAGNKLFHRAQRGVFPRVPQFFP